VIDAVSLQARGVVSRYFDRVLTPAETLAAMRPRLPEFGITRLARLTGLDEVGIPVWAAIRPNALTLAVSQGKGVDDAAAAASAMMEAVEVATAERRDLPRLTLAPRAMAASGRRTAQLTELLRLNASPPAADEPVDWIEGFDLIDDAPVWVPLDAVRLGEEAAQARYWQSTDGLASGNVLWEAAFHGLCERVERDALALWSLCDDSEVGDRCRDPRDFADPELDALAAKIEAAGLRLRLFDISTDVAIPVCFAAVSPASDGDLAHWRHFDLQSGSGCHPDLARAAIRAVTEAAQSRLTAISGARDDFDPGDYRARIALDLSPFARAEPAADGPAAAAVAAAIAPAEYIGRIASRLTAVGVGSAIVVPLESGERGFAVAKALVADLETIPGARRFPLGRRALRAKLARR
jgi:ribosomal protein S12 methylthiotransferase accessory factor